MHAGRWVDPGVCTGLCWLAADDRKGNPSRPSLPLSLYSDAIAPFLRFDAPLPNQLYAIGGRNQQDGPLDTVEMFNTWHGQWEVCPSMQVRRAGCAAAELDGRLLVVGGYDEHGIVKGLLASCEVFDPIEEKWGVAAPLQRARWGHGCASVGGLCYTVGGCSLRPGSPPRELFMETLRSCEAYDPEADQWFSCKDLHLARAGLRVVIMGERYLAAVGGCDDVFGRAEMLPSVELYDVTVGYWMLLNMTLSTPRTTAAVAALDENQILVIGGAPSLSSAEVYRMPERTECSGGTARQPTVCDMAEGRMGCQAVALDLPAPGATYPHCSRHCIVVVGGEGGDEDWESDQTDVKQFSSVLVYDIESDEWRKESTFPPMPAPRTAMALCVGLGRVSAQK